MLTRTDLFSAVIAQQTWTQYNLIPLGDPGSIRLVMPQIVSPNYFSKLGVTAHLGRVLVESDASATSHIPVVLSYQFWQSQFHARKDVVGRTLRLKNYPFVIVGVLPKEFHSIDIERAPDVRLPISAMRILTGHTVRDGGAEYFESFEILARLASGVSPAYAAAAVRRELQTTREQLLREANTVRPKPWPANDLEDIINEIRRAWYDWLPVGRGVSQLRDQFSRALKLLMGAVALLLIAVCANVAGLLLAKAEERRKEIAVRLSIGATQWRILRQLLSENLLIALAGAALGIAFTYALSPLLLGMLPSARGYDQFATPRIVSVTPDARVLLFAIAICAIGVFLFGLAPAWRGIHVDLHSELKGTSRTSGKAIAGIAPVALQVALAVVLIAAATLMARTFWSLEHLDPGFDRAHIAEFAIDVKDAGYSDTQAGVFFRELRERVRSLPGVRGAAYAGRGLMRGVGIKTTVSPQGVVLPQSTFLNASLNAITPSYFATMGIPLIAGRSLAENDIGKKPEPIVINRALADLIFPHQNPIGKFVVSGTDGTKPPADLVVGLVATAKYRSMREPDPPTIYFWFDENDHDNSSSYLYVRTYGDPARIINAVRSTLRRLGPAVVILEISTLEQDVRNSLWQERLVALLSGFFGVAALALAALGLYGALAYSVGRRTRELGIRIAIGALPRHIVETVCGRMSWAIGIGLTAGILASIALLGLTRRLLFGISPLDAASFAISASVVLLCAIFASLLPSWRAVRTNASAALRDE